MEEKNPLHNIIDFIDLLDHSFDNVVKLSVSYLGEEQKIPFCLQEDLKPLIFEMIKFQTSLSHFKSKLYRDLFDLNDEKLSETS